MRLVLVDACTENRVAGCGMSDEMRWATLGYAGLCALYLAWWLAREGILMNSILEVTSTYVNNNVHRMAECGFAARGLLACVLRETAYFCPRRVRAGSAMDGEACWLLRGALRFLAGGGGRPLS